MYQGHKDYGNGHGHSQLDPILESDLEDDPKDVDVDTNINVDDGLSRKQGIVVHCSQDARKDDMAIFLKERVFVPWWMLLLML